MSNRRSLLATQGSCFIAAALFSISGLVATAPAQRERPAGPPDLKRAQRDREQREAVLRTAETGAAVVKLDEKRIEAAVNQLKDDFRRVQIIRNEIVRALLANQPLDYKLISNRAGEVNKRAERLKTFLIPPVDGQTGKKQKGQIEIDSEQMKDVLVRFCELIDGFVENPVMKTPGSMNVEQSTKAGADLLSIIELSDAIKRSAEKLSRANR